MSPHRAQQVTTGLLGVVARPEQEVHLHDAAPCHDRTMHMLLWGWDAVVRASRGDGRYHD